MNRATPFEAEALAAIFPALPTEVAVWQEKRLEDGSTDVPLAEVRVLADRPEPSQGDTSVVTRVACICWRTDTGEIQRLWVREGLRREGIATRLYRAAQFITGGQLRHSAWRTNDGELWALSLHQPLPERKHA